MDFSLVLAFTLLFTTVVPAKENPYRFCSSELRAHHPHLKTSQGSIRLPLHHPRSPCSPAPLPSVIPFSTILLHDSSRIVSLYSRSSKAHHRRSSVSPGTAFPLFLGDSLGVASYVTQIDLGSPSSSYGMIVDTGSSLTWLQCSPCSVSCHDQVGPIFNPSASTSYSSISCFASECSSLAAATHNPYSCSATNVCMYQVVYADGSLSIGNLGKDTLKLGSLAIPKFIHGCGQLNEGLLGRTAGLIGLGLHNLSFLGQVSKKTGAFAFSYCLPTAQSTGFLSIGPYAASKFSFTPLVRGFFDDSLYSIKLASIKLNRKPIPMSSSSSYDTPIIVDSGTVITRLPSDVYSALKHALTARLKKKKIPRAGAYLILDTCFIGSVKKIALPKISMVFEGGAEIKLAARNVMIDVNETLTCLAFAAATTVPLLGSRQQQTFSVVYDVGRGRVGFASGGCR